MSLVDETDVATEDRHGRRERRARNRPAMDADAPPRTEQTPADGAIEAAAEDVARRRANR